MNEVQPGQLDMDVGTQPADINSIGATAQTVSGRKLVFFGVMALLIVIFAVLVGRHYWGELTQAIEQKRQPKQSLTPPPSEQTSQKVQLPDARTPLDSSWAAAQPNDSVRTVPPACPVTSLVDKQTGLVVRGADGQALKVDCKGVVQSSGSTNPVAPGIISTQPSVAVPGSTPGAPSTGLNAPTLSVLSRYEGDTALRPSAPVQSSTSFLPSMGSGMGALPTPPVSAAQLESRIKNLLAAGNTSSPSAITTTANPILSTGTNTPVNPQGPVGAMLGSATTPKAMALKAFDPNLTIPKGDGIDCTMTTRVVTEISGFTSCVVSSPVYSANGKVLLIERMSEIQGEYTAVGQPGQRRVYVLWSRIRKPGGITIDIASPSTDPLGAAGMEGIVDNRWFERIGSAFLLSIFKDFLAASTVESAGGTAGINGAAAASIYQNSINTSTAMVEKVLSQSINIKPIVYANQGERVSIYVARDLDFSSVYSVKPSTAQERQP